MSYITITAKEAKKQGYKPLTYPFTTDEYPMLKKVIADMERGPIDYALVTESERLSEIAVYRKTHSD